MFIKQQNKGIIFLSGGGGATQTKKLDLIFSKYIDGKKLMYIPIAINRDALGFEACYDWISGTFLSFEYKKDVPLIDMFLDPDSIKKHMHKYDAIYIGGGNTYKLLDFIYKHGIEKYLIDFYDSGKVIYGGSAGAIILGKDIRTVIEENDNDYKRNLGLNLIKDFSIRCHYDNKEEDLIKNRNEKFNLKTIALTESAGLIIENNELTFLGDYKIYE